jgi:hypothetical protein
LGTIFSLKMTTNGEEVEHLNIEELDKKCQEKYGFDLRNCYRLSMKFYKGDLFFKKKYKLRRHGTGRLLKNVEYFAEHEGKSVQLQYNDKLRLVAFTQQATQGKLAEDKMSPLGALDVIGKDRR